MSFDREVSVKVKLTPEDLAKQFWAMYHYEQVEFFNYLGRLNRDDFQAQMKAVVTNHKLTPAALRAMRDIANPC